MFFYVFWFLIFTYFMMYLFRLNAKIYSLFILLTIAIPAAMFDPVEAYLYHDIQLDTFRIFDEMFWFRSKGWESLRTYDGVIGSKAYIYFFSLFDCDILLPIATVILSYGVMIYMLNVIGKELQISERIKCLTILGCVLSQSYLYIFTNIRMPLAIAIVSSLLARELLVKRNILACRSISLIMCCFHQGVMIAIFARLLAKSMKFSSLMLLGMIFIYQTKFDDIVNILLSFDNVFFIGVGLKFLSYSDHDSTISIFRYIYLWIDVLLVCFLSLYIRRKLPKDYKSESVRIFLNINIILSLFGAVGLTSNIIAIDIIERPVWIISWLFMFYPYISHILTKLYKNDIYFRMDRYVNICFVFFVLVNFIYHTSYMSHSIF